MAAGVPGHGVTRDTELACTGPLRQTLAEMKMPDQRPVSQGDHPFYPIGWPTFTPSRLAGFSTAVLHAPDMGMAARSAQFIDVMGQRDAELRDGPLAGQIALVTGGGRGLGKAIAERLAADGAVVAVGYAGNAAAAAATVEGIAARGGAAFVVGGDISQVSGIEAMFSALDEELRTRTSDHRFHILVNNAGINVSSPFGEVDEPTFDKVFATNVKGTFFVTQMAIPRLHDNGRIINITTGLTRFVFPGYAAYAASKGAIQVLTQFLAAELGERGITVNDIAPGATDTDINATWLRDDEGAQRQLAATTALGRVGQPVDIAGVAAFLASRDSGWVTAQHIEASGGAQL